MDRFRAHPSPRPASRRPRRGAGGGNNTTPRPKPAISTLEAALAAAAARVVEPAPSFAAMGLPERLVTALARRGVSAPFAIQGRAIPDALAGRDVLGRAQTGSGKTLAFGLPMLARLAGERRVPGQPHGLVLVPTRELAEQVKEALAPLGQALDLQVTAIYGGASMNRQISALRRGTDVVIATPGRLQDLINQRECSLGAVAVTVLDEADYLADLGFLPAVRALLDSTPPTGQRLLFSATLDRGVDRLVSDYLTDPAVHAITPPGSTVSTMDHRAFTVRSEDKVAVAAMIATRPGRTLFFVRTKHGADRLAKQLQRTGVSAGALHGNLAQNARQRALDAFASGSARVLVATDVAARGIHVDDVDLVVHFDPPADSKDYLHRSGRTARAGADGVVLSLLLPEQVTEVARLHRGAGVHAVAAAVSAESDAVQELAASGTPIVVVPAAPRAGVDPTRPPRRRRPAPSARRLPRAASSR